MIERAYPPIAVVGMHGRFPRSADLTCFFKNQLEGRDAIGTVPSERWDWRKLAGEPSDTADHSYSKDGGFISHVDCFDAQFFGILPREAESMDPQQRLFLQTAWSTFEDAGHAPSALAGTKVGVFVGVGNADYPVMMRRDGVPIDAHRATGMALTSVANRVSFLLDLRGPSEIVDTACSSSLVAIHRAVNAIHNGECEMALAGGVNLLLGPELYIAFSKAGMLSRKGRCRAFDAACDGYVRGEGVGAILLCPLDAAERRGDHIYGVIRGSAENHGGRAHSFVAPNAPAQADVIQAAWRRAGVAVSRATFIETHGTGTPLGDPIEINGLKTAVAADPPPPDQKPIRLRALKSHIGHLEAAAGIAAVISALMALEWNVVPGTLHHAALNPHIDLSDTPFQIGSAPVALEHSDESEPHLAGISSFGFGGVNAHIVLQARLPETPRQDDRTRARLVVLSAKTPAALRARASQLLAMLAEPRQALGKRSVCDALCRALGRSANADGGDIALAALSVTPHALEKALADVSAELGVTIRFRDMRDCVTIGEMAEAISACASPQPEVLPDDPSHLACGVAVPECQARAASLAEIAFTLLEGRDPMRERLAMIVESKDDLRARLSEFIGSETAQADRWLRGAPRSNDTPRPAADTGHDSLGDWARWFVGAREARLRWRDLHDEPAPRRVPLPAHPFELTRIWYRAPGHVTQTSAPALAQAPSSVSTGGMIALWHGAWEPSRQRPSDATVALARLVAHASDKSDRLSVFNDIRFGPPVTLDTHRPLTERRNGSTLQCVQDGPVGYVLAEARIVGSVPPQARDFIEPPRTPIGVAAFGERLSRSGLALSTLVRVPSEIRTSAGAIVLPLAPDPAVPDIFWVHALALAAAGWQYLAGATGGMIMQPYTVESLAYDSARVRQASQLVVAWNGIGPARIVWHDGGDAIALAIEGVQLRPAACASGAAL